MLIDRAMNNLGAAFADRILNLVFLILSSSGNPSTQDCLRISKFHLAFAKTLEILMWQYKATSVETRTPGKACFTALA